MTSLTVLIILALAALFAPYMHTTNPIVPDYSALYASPSAHHWFGTDALGRDLYSRILYGLRVPFAVGVIGTVITVVLGTLFGLMAGYFGGVIDSVMSRFTDLMFAFPAFLLALIVVTLFGGVLDPYFGGAGRVLVLIIIFSLVSWPGLMRFVRSLALGLKESQFVEAARTSGSSDWKILRRHLLPNIYGLVLVQASLIVVGVIYTEASLSIFGLGVGPPNPDVGVMLYDGTQALGFSYWPVIMPALFLTILLLAFSFLGDGVRDAVDPRMNA